MSTGNPRPSGRGEVKLPPRRHIRRAVLTAAVIGAGLALYAIHQCVFWSTLTLLATWTARRIWSERTRNRNLWKKGSPT